MYGGRLLGHAVVSSIIATGLVALPATVARATDEPTSKPPAASTPPEPTPIDSPRNASMKPVFDSPDSWQPPTGLGVTTAQAELAARRTGSRWEATAARTEMAKIYVNPDGTRTLVASSGRQHVRRTEGWVDLDLTLRVVDGVVRPVATGADVTFSAGGAGPLVRFRRLREAAWRGVEREINVRLTQLDEWKKRDRNGYWHAVSRDCDQYKQVGYSPVLLTCEVAFRLTIGLAPYLPHEDFAHSPIGVLLGLDDIVDCGADREVKACVFAAVSVAAPVGRLGKLGKVDDVLDANRVGDDIMRTAPNDADAARTTAVIGRRPDTAVTKNWDHHEVLISGMTGL